MLGTYKHRGGPPPLRPEVTYEYPFELYAAHLPTCEEHCLRLPWRPRDGRDDVGVVVHQEQDAFVVAALARAAIPHRASAPGEYVFPNAHGARRAIAALGGALGASGFLWWKLGAITAQLDLTRRTPALVVRWPAVPSEAYSEWEDTGRIGLDVIHEPSAARIARAWLDEDTMTFIHDALRVAQLAEPEVPRELIRTWSRTVCRGFLPADLDYIDTLEVRPTGVTFETYSHSYGVRADESATRHTLAELADAACPVRVTVLDALARIDAFLAQLRG